MKMRNMVLGVIALTSAVAVQAESLNIPRNAKVVSSDGQEIGLVNRVLTAADNSVTAIRIIMGTRMVTLGAEQLSVDGAVVKTKLTKKEVERWQ